MTPERWRAIEDLYHAALDRDPAARAALLDCSDPEIRARVEQMLAVDTREVLLDRPAVPLLQHLEHTAFAPGHQFGPYRIEAPVGAGGMGTVYRATDTRLGRTVAIKVSAARYSERFQREALAIATLNHPHVCTLYDVGPDYLVMEFIEGSTLAGEIRNRPLSAETTARYGAQIAAALAEAHAHGIVHRDLKPANIMLTRHGVKVLDFGLARLTSALDLTEPDAIMATPAYVAPEQVEGRAPTGQTDLFALGLVLYEMAAGRLPFPGASLGQMIAGRSRIAVPPLPPASARLNALVMRLLHPDPLRRGDSAQVAAELSTIAAAAPHAGSALRRIPAWAYAVAAAFAILLTLSGLWLRHRASSTPSNVLAPGGPSTWTQLTSFTDFAVAPALSPDGRLLAFYRSDISFFSPGQIWVKLLPDGEPIQLTHDPRQKYGISFSPDGTRLAYAVFENGFDTYTVSSLGGNSTPFLRNAAGLNWLDAGHLLFSRIKSGVHMGIVSGNADGSALREVYLPAHERGMAHYSYLSPDGKWVLLVEMDPEWQPCRLVPFAGGSLGRQVGPPGACTAAAWSTDGAWMYFNAQVSGQKHLWRQRFPNGKPEQITSGDTEEDGIAVAPDGRSLITSVMTRQYAVWYHDSRGDYALSTEGYADPAPPLFSSDGRHLYYLLRRDSPQSPAELWRADLRSRATQVALPGYSITAFDVSADQKQAVFSTAPAVGSCQLWIAALDRSEPPRRIGMPGDCDPHFGANGRVLFRLTEGNASYLGAMRADGTGREKVLPQRFVEIEGVSPDRRFLTLIAADPSAPANAVSTFAVPTGGGSPQVVCDFGSWAGWSLDGRTFFVLATGQAHGANLLVKFPVNPPSALPRLPAAGITQEWFDAHGTPSKVPDGYASGLHPSEYAWIKSSSHANLFRIPLQ